jgi:quinol monooxygenase YgiN
MTIIVTAVFHPHEGKINDLVAALTTTIPAVQEETGCLLFAIHEAEDGTITAIEKWASDADLEAHGTGTAVASLKAAVTPLLAEQTTVTRMIPRQVGTREKGLL